MNREFLINIIFLLGINLLIKPFYIFGIDRTVQNTVGPEDYGVFFALFNFTYLFQIINDFGIQNYNNRKIAQNNKLIDQYFPAILILKGLLGLLFLFVVFTVVWTTGYDPGPMHLIFFIAVNQILISLQFYLRSNISGLGMYRKDSIVSSLDKLFMILLCGFLLWFYKGRSGFSIDWFVYAQTVSLLLAALIAFVIIKGKLGRVSFSFDFAFLQNILRESYPFALVIFLMMVYTRVDAVMLERMLPDGKLETGIYASAYRLLDAANMLGFLFAGLLLPMFSKMLKAKESVRSLLKMSAQLIWAASISVAVITYSFRTEIMTFLYYEATPYWGEVMGYLLFTFIAVSGSYIFGTLLTANGSLMKMNIVFIIGVIMNVLLNYWLIPDHKALGATMATLFTQFFVLAGQIYLVHKIFGFSLQGSIFFRLVGFFIALGIGGNLFHDFFSQSWYTGFLLTSLLAVLLAFLFQLIKLKSLKELLPSSKS